MKTITTMFLLATLLLLALNSYGQFIRFGAKAGVNLSNLNIDESDYQNYITGGHVGLWLNAPLPGAFSVQPEILFTQKGNKSVYNDDEGERQAEIKLGLNYLEMPVHLVYQLFRNLEIEAGPYWGYLVNPKIESYLSTPFGNMSFWDELNVEDFERFDLGFSAGARVQLKRMYLGLSYKVGLEPVSKEKNFTELMLGDASNQSFQIYGAFRF